MTRYIDADKALQIIDSYAKTVTKEGKVVVDAVRDIVAIITPTADVVPRAEVEEAQADAGRLAKVYARLIFAELEEFNRPPMPECEPLYIIKKSEMEALKERLGVQRWIKPKH